MINRFALALFTSACFFNVACADDVTKTAQAAQVQAEPVQAVVKSVGSSFNAPDQDWRDLDPENTLYLDVEYGRFVIELFPEIAPKHVTQIKTLARQSFYDHITFHRVIDGFMNQTGDPKGDGSGNSDLPDLPSEFTFRRGADVGFTVVGARPDNRGGEIGVGFYKSLQIASQPSSQAILTKDGKVTAYGLHCSGVTSMARTNDPNSANSQFFLMRGTAEHLDATYSVWGNTVWGRQNLTKIKVGSKGENPNFVADKIIKAQIAADVPEAERLNVQVLKTDSSSFQRFLKAQKKQGGSYPDVCDIDVPSRIKK